MPHEPGSALEWLEYAQSNILLAKTGSAPGILYEHLCFHAQQATEMAIKAVLIHSNVPVQKVH